MPVREWRDKRHLRNDMVDVNFADGLLIPGEDKPVSAMASNARSAPVPAPTAFPLLYPMRSPARS